MRSRTADWFLCRIKYDKTMEDGLQKKVTEQFVVDALSFTEAECRIMEQMASYISGTFDVHEIDRCVYKEVFFADEDTADKWYKAKLQFITIDERTAKEKKSNIYYLVNGSSLEDARKNIDDVMSDTMIDYTIAALSETPIMDVFECQSKICQSKK